MNYRILYAFSAEMLEAKIKDGIKEGWTPAGGVSVAPIVFDRVKLSDSDYENGNSTEIWAQALTKHEKETKQTSPAKTAQTD